MPREDVFLTTKFYPGHRDPEAEAVQSLRRLGVDRVDLYIVHWPHNGPLASCVERDIVLEAYSPLGTGRHLGDNTVAQIAANVGRTPAQVLLRWCLQRSTVVIPKSTHRERIEENAQIFDFTLSDEVMAALDQLDRTGGTAAAREQKWW